MTRLLLFASAFCLIVPPAGLAYFVASARPASRPKFGRLGRNRAYALQKYAWCRFAETPVRYLASRLEPFLPRWVHARVEHSLSAAGHPLGLTAPELLSGSIALGVALCMCLIPLGRRYELSGFGTLVAAIVIASIPFFRVATLGKWRIKRIELRLPSVLELIVMCMSAGLDLPRSLRCVVDSATDRFDPLVEELETVVRELELGRTRREALRDLAERVSSPEIEELVNSVIQSEQKGVSLSKTLAIQSRTARLRRSMHAEQAASGAALMLVGPMSLIFLCVIALLLGPVLIRTTTGGFGT